jgi:hypothetical protein
MIRGLRADDGVPKMAFTCAPVAGLNWAAVFQVKNCVWLNALLSG